MGNTSLYASLGRWVGLYTSLYASLGLFVGTRYPRWCTLAQLHTRYMHAVYTVRLTNVHF